jgi:hypothetical protein
MYRWHVLLEVRAVIGNAEDGVAVGHGIEPEGLA